MALNQAGSPDPSIAQSQRSPPNVGSPLQGCARASRIVDAGDAHVGFAADHLRATGFEVTAGAGKTRVVGLLGNGDGLTIMLRADRDALPIEEATGLPYASKITGKDGGFSTPGRRRRKARKP